ncbi:MAG TPA: M15 family metallopeptidase [Candidatus Saccharimonadales bacterium]|nr:M15 family metallopeptidase [Candidatus Saccharimonadales bacterium]
MRKSVERQQHAKAVAETIHTSRVAHHRRLAAIIILALIILDTAIIGIFQLQANQTIAATQKKFASDQTVVAVNKPFTHILASVRQTEAHSAEQTVKSIPAYPQKVITNTTSITATAHCDVNNPTSILVIVNKKHCINPPSWAPPDLASLDGYLMRSIAATHMQEMMQAATAAGLPFGITSAYRSYDDQVATYNNWVQVNGSTASADTVSARPGYSEHQTGLAADLKTDGCVLDCFTGTAQYTWLQQNAANYGFIQRYPTSLTSITGYSAEPWHWRYVGSDTALAMKRSGVQTLEEYLGVSGGDYN